MLAAEKFPNDESYRELCGSLGAVAQLETTILHDWLAKLVTASSGGGASGAETSHDDKTIHTADETKFQENRQLLQSITSYIVKDGSHVGEEVAKSILTALLPLGETILSSTSANGMSFSELLSVMATLAGAGSGAGHVTLVKAACDWLKHW